MKRHLSPARLALVALLAVALLAVGACSKSEKAKKPPVPQPIGCTGPTGVGSAVPAGTKHGDILGAVELTTGYNNTPGFPTNARVWRVLYATSGTDETQLEAVCGMVAVPTSGPKLFNGRARMFAWAHGTVGVAQGCLPSNDPASMLWGQMSAGINTIAWDGILPNSKHLGTPDNGLLQTVLNGGMVVAETDYQPNRYIIGPIAAANVLDLNRAASLLVAAQWQNAPSAYDLFIAGHSQGGHSAMWSAQLASSYYAKTTQSLAAASFRLVGVALEAPAVNFITDPAQQSGVSISDGLADWEMHWNVEVVPGVDIPALTLQAGPALFSYIFGSWNDQSSAGQPASGAKFPATPSNAPLQLDALLTQQGINTLQEVMPLCLTGDQAKQVQDIVAPYRDAKTNQMLIPQAWGQIPSDYKPGTFFKGSMGQLCADTKTGPIANWCTWLRWNLPGPLGQNPFDKVPTQDGKLVPMFVAQGGADDIIHCIQPSGSENDVPSASACMSRAFYDTMSQKAYCPNGKNVGYLQYEVYRPIVVQSPASHLSIPGQVSSASQDNAPSGLKYNGSKLQTFMQAAFDGSLQPGCTSQVANRLSL
ncbi:MAG: hypothetical protein ACOYNI_11650 [Acidimicrobiia bacterium]